MVAELKVFAHFAPKTDFAAVVELKVHLDYFALVAELKQMAKLRNVLDHQTLPLAYLIEVGCTLQKSEIEVECTALKQSEVVQIVAATAIELTSSKRTPLDTLSHFVSLLPLMF